MVSSIIEYNYLVRLNCEPLYTCIDGQLDYLIRRLLTTVLQGQRNRPSGSSAPSFWRPGRGLRTTYVFFRVWPSGRIWAHFSFQRRLATTAGLSRSAISGSASQAREGCGGPLTPVGAVARWFGNGGSGSRVALAVALWLPARWLAGWVAGWLVGRSHQMESRLRVEKT